MGGGTILDKEGKGRRSTKHYFKVGLHKIRDVINICVPVLMTIGEKNMLVPICEQEVKQDIVRHLCDVMENLWDVMVHLCNDMGHCKMQKDTYEMLLTFM